MKKVEVFSINTPKTGEQLSKDTRWGEKSSCKDLLLLKSISKSGLSALLLTGFFGCKKKKNAHIIF